MTPDGDALSSSRVPDGTVLLGTGSITNGAMSSLASLPASIVRSAVSTSLPAGSLSKFAMMTAPRPDAPHVHMVGGFRRIDGAVAVGVDAHPEERRPDAWPRRALQHVFERLHQSQLALTSSEARDPHGVTHEVAKEQVGVVAGGSAAPSWCGPSTVNAVIAGHLLTSSDSFVEPLDRSFRLLRNVQVQRSARAVRGDTARPELPLFRSGQEVGAGVGEVCLGARHIRRQHRMILIIPKIGPGLACACGFGMPPFRSITTFLCKRTDWVSLPPIVSKKR